MLVDHVAVWIFLVALGLRLSGKVRLDFIKPPLLAVVVGRDSFGPAPLSKDIDIAATYAALAFENAMRQGNEKAATILAKMHAGLRIMVETEKAAEEITNGK